MASNNSISILIEAKDEASRVLASTADNFRAATSNFKASSDAVGKAGEAVENGTAKSSGSLLKMGAVMGAVAGIAQNVVADAFGAVRDSISDAVSRVDTLNNFPRVMSNFGVSAQDASKMIADLDKGVRGLPTTLDSIASLAQGFVPLTKNTDEATKTALALNNAILAGGAPMQVQSAAMEQFRQALSKGVPDLQDWKTLEMAMPAQLQQTADKLGIGSGAMSSYAKNGLGLYQAMKDGKLSMEDFNRALVSLNQEGINGLPNFAEQAKNSTQGIATGFTNMRTSVVRGVSDIINTIGAGNISGAMSNVGGAFEASAKQAAGLVRELQGVANFAMSHSTMTAGLISSMAALKVAMNFSAISSSFNGFIAPMVTRVNSLRTAAMAASAAFVAAGGSVRGFQAALAALNFNPLILAATLGGAAIGMLVSKFIQIQNESRATSGSLANQKYWHDQLTAAENRNRDASNALHDAQLNLKGANLQVEQAQRNYNTAVEQYGPKSLEARQAAYDLQVAQDAQKRAAADAANKTRDAANANREYVAVKDAASAASNQMGGSAASAAANYGNLAASIRAAKDEAAKMPAGPAKSGAQIQAEFGMKPMGKNAVGTSFWRGGRTLVGENGPEILDLPAGSRISNSGDTQRALNSGGGTTISIQFLGPVNMRSEQDAQNLADKINQAARLNQLGMAA